MKKEYLVAEILHSGRKGTRNTPVDDIKYKGLLGFKVGFDVNELERGQDFRMWVFNSPYYSEWYTSMIIAATIDTRDNTLLLETENSIYILKEVADADTY